MALATIILTAAHLESEALHDDMWAGARLLPPKGSRPGGENSGSESPKWSKYQNGSIHMYIYTYVDVCAWIHRQADRQIDS